MDMREKIARAIAVEIERQSRAGKWVGDLFVPDDGPPNVRLIADAALDAMIEPTEEMIERGQGCLDCTPVNRCEEQAHKVWRGMIYVARNGADD